MKYCVHCGKQLTDDAIYCTECGARQDGSYNGYTQNQNACNSGDKYSVLSIVGFVFSFLDPIIGLIISIIALKEARTAGSKKSENFARYGVIISAIYGGLLIVILTLSFVLLFAGLFAAIASIPGGICITLPVVL